jgi:hypothetical protein
MPADEIAMLRVCPRDGAPVVFTFEFPGAEYHCVECGWLGDIFGPGRAPATPDLVARFDTLSDRYEAERAERTGRPAPRPAPQDVPRPTCGGCGAVAEGRLDHSGKPAHWYSRTRDGVKQYACSRGCIKEGAVLPW